MASATGNYTDETPPAFRIRIFGPPHNQMADLSDGFCVTLNVV